MEYVVYALSGADGEIRYIGMTGNLAIRFKSHLAPVGNSRKAAWCRKTLAAGGAVSIRVLYHAKDQIDCATMEKQLIQAYRPELNTMYLARSKR